MSKPLDKIHHDLQEILATESDQGISALVECQGQPLDLELGSPQKGGLEPQVISLSLPDEDEVPQKMDVLEKHLQEILHNQPVRLDIAEAFCVEATPEQLKRIAELDEVSIIRPNRTYDVQS